MATLALAHWAVTLSYHDLGDSVQAAARRSFYNWIGCAIGGADHPTVDRAYRALEGFFAQEKNSTLYGRRRGGSTRADVPHAALLNGIASHVHDYDDTHLATIIHPTGPVASAAIAYAEGHDRASEPGQTKITGQDLLLAIVVGIEASCKLGLAVWPSHYDIGWHITSTTGGIGAAVAVGKLKGLNEEQMAHAIGLASVSVTGLREMFGSDTKSYHVGEAAMVGIRAASLAEMGFTSSTKALEAKRGWANVVVGGGAPQLDKYIGELGSVWEIERNSFKPFPCGIVCHPAIDAAVQAHEEMARQDLSPQQIKSVRTRVHPLVIELTSKRTPKDGLEGKFSVFHGCAVGLIYGQARPAEYSDEVVQRSEVIAVRDKVEALSEQALGADEAYLEVEFTNGQKISKHIKHAVGSLEVPMTDSQLKEKFVAQCRDALGQAVENVSSKMWNFSDAPSVSALVDSFKD